MKRWVREALNAKIGGRGECAELEQNKALGSLVSSSHRQAPPLRNERPPSEWENGLLTALQLYRDFQHLQLNMTFEEWLIGSIWLERKRQDELEQHEKLQRIVREEKMNG